MGMVDGHGAFEKEQESGWEGQCVKVGWLVAMWPLRRNKTLAGRVRVSKRGWLMAMGLLKRNKILDGGG